MSKQQEKSSRLNSFVEFKGAFFVSLCAFFLALGIMVLNLFITTEADIQAYQKLKEAANPKAMELQDAAYTAKQLRSKLLKEVLFTQGNDRLKLRLTGHDSSLIFDHFEGQTAIVERINDVKCWMQEELYFLLPDGREAVRQSNGKLLIRHADPKQEASWVQGDLKGMKPMQIIRYMEADAADYYYKTDKFVAEQVKLSRHIVPGHELITSVEGYKQIMKGVAQSIEFSLAGKDLNFKAIQLKAAFYGNGRSL